jgi:hypothetical protein
MSRPRELWVFDADETVLRVHSFALRRTPEQAASLPLDEEVADAPFVRSLLDALAARGHLAAVASFGVYDVLHAYLERIRPGAFGRANLSTPEAVGGVDGCAVPGGKTRQLDALRQALLGTDDRSRVLFLDDSAANVELARRAGYSRAYVVPQGGLTRAAWLAIATAHGEDPLVESACSGV